MRSKQHGTNGQAAAVGATAWPLIYRLTSLVVALLLAACAQFAGPGATTTQLALSTQPPAAPTQPAPTQPPPAGTATVAGGTAAPETPTAAAVATTTLGGTPGALANGCPEQQAPASAGTKPDVAVGNQFGGTGSASLAVGQLLEVRLGASLRWTLTLSDPTHVLAPVDHNGWYDPGQNTCVWRFTGQTPGTVTLVYGGRPICEPDKACPQFVIASDFTVTVKG